MQRGFTFAVYRPAPRITLFHSIRDFSSGVCNVEALPSRAQAARQEWKATLTVGIVLATFICCWLPFFVLAVYRPLAGEEAVPGESKIYNAGRSLLLALLLYSNFPSVLLLISDLRILFILLFPLFAFKLFASCTLVLKCNFS